MLAINILVWFIYIFVAAILYMGLSSVGGLFGFIWQGIGIPLLIALPVIGVLFAISRLVPAIWRMREKPRKGRDQPELAIAMVAVVIVTVAIGSGLARATFMLDHNPVVQVSTADASARPMRLFFSSGDFILFADGACNLIYRPLAVIDKIEHQPKADLSFPRCSNASKNLDQN
ncbi:MAG: hypothetical protein Q4G22_12670 [Paracoccus sp. (in: a-proteobacteria)]|uniref:hypothetical protein n=1 Tax=Paracoccus sp. TaxID=267 RepID=UPI0026DF2302|nr:hypothetical protein [Paracoccus sp. (in: a-proteobacteria)]MDO5632672.1 hypothetical protein [Paracoccus sp. (in: a-proteobacteria)]